jgi:peptide/nickel transport system substrate-binding protein
LSPGREIPLKTRVALIGLVTGLLAIAACSACKPGSRNGPTGKPVPPFEGDVSPDAQVADIVPGTYCEKLVIGIPSSPNTFNAVTAVDTNSLWVIGDVLYKSLSGYDNYEQKDAAGLAKSWDVSPDGLTWTFHLRQGVRWSDGEPFDADDVIFSFQATFDPAIPSINRNLFTQSDGSSPTYDKVDDYTVRLHLKEPNAFVIGALNNVYLVPKHKWETAYRSGTFAQAIGVTTDPKDVVGLGPYRLASYVPDQKVEVERNPYYWKVDNNKQRLPYIDRVIFVVVPNNNTWALKMTSGELDMQQQIFPGVLDTIEQGAAKQDYKVWDLGASFNTTYLVLNQDPRKDKSGKPYVDPVKLKWFREVKFRQAVSYGIDREAMIRTALGRPGEALYGFDSKANKLWYTADVHQYPYDPEKAKGLLKEIGIWDRDGDGVAEDSDGHPIKFILNVNAGNDVRVSQGTLIKDNLKKIGIDVNLQPIDSNLLNAKLHQTRDFDAQVGAWQASVPPDPVGSKDILLPSGELYVAYPGQKEPSTDWEKKLAEYINLCSRTNDLAERQKYYWEAMKLWSEYLPEIDLIAGDYYVAAKNKIGNLKPSALANFTYWNIEELYFK